MAELLKNVAFIGASGNLGSATLEAILKHNKHNVTVITRPSSEATYPPSVAVKQGDYTDPAFLEPVLRGQDVLIVMLAFVALPAQHDIFRAAAKAGVRYILPSDYGMASGSDQVAKAVPLMRGRRDDHALIASLGMKWISVVTNGWTDYCVQNGFFDILAPERKATIYIDSAPFVTTSIAHVAAGIANMLSLPQSAIDEEFANSYLYLSSFVLTQPEIFAAVLRATATKEEEWQVERKTVQELIDEGWKDVNAGQTAGHFKILFGNTYLKEIGGDYSAHSHNTRLGLEPEDLDAVVSAAVAAARPGGSAVASSLALK